MNIRYGLRMHIWSKLPREPVHALGVLGNYENQYLHPLWRNHDSSFPLTLANQTKFEIADQPMRRVL